MALSTSKPEATSCSSHVTPAATGLLLLVMTVNVSSTAPTNYTVNLTKQIYWGMEILTYLGANLDISIMDVYQSVRQY